MTASISARLTEALTAIATGLHDIADAVRGTRQIDDAQATIDALNERCRILVDEGDAFRNDLTNLREGLMERVGRYTPSDADLLAYVDGLRAQIATQEPAGEPHAPSGGVGTSSTLSARLRALIPATYSDDGYFGVTALEIGEFADEAHRLEVHARVVEQSLRTARAEDEELESRLTAVLNLAGQWTAAQKANRESLERGELAVLHVPTPSDFELAATGCPEVPEPERAPIGLGKVAP